MVDPSLSWNCTWRGVWYVHERQQEGGRPLPWLFFNASSGKYYRRVHGTTGGVRCSFFFEGMVWATNFVDPGRRETLVFAREFRIWLLGPFLPIRTAWGGGSWVQAGTPHQPVSHPITMQSGVLCNPAVPRDRSDGGWNLKISPENHSDDWFRPFKRGDLLVPGIIKI